MTNRFTRELSYGKRALLASAETVVIAGLIIAGLVNPPRVRSQPHAATTVLPKFEVASIKPAPADAAPVAYPNDPGRYGIRIPLGNIIGMAYRVKYYQISGPAWLDRASFEIVAKLPNGATRNQIPQMLQALLAERFNLAVHRETKTLPVYGLIISKGGLKLKKAEPASGQRRVASRRTGVPARELNGPYTMAALAAELSTDLDRPVLDLTGLKGTYDLNLAWTPDEHDAALLAGLSVVQNNGTLIVRPRNDPVSTADSGSNAPGGPNVLDALQTLGLKLDGRKGPVEVLVIDHVNRMPTGN